MATRIVGMVCSSLPEGCSKLNQIMYGKMADRYASLLVMTIEGAQGVMAWVRCGHLPPIHISDGGSRYEILTSGGAAIGLQPVAQFDKALKTETAIPEPGDRIILYTDGINESRSRNDSGDELTVKGLAAIASDMITRHPDISSSMLAQRILDFDRHRSGASRLEDDACVLVIRRK
jgi:serine phosphatase RsbU (regulator of sigma subunit)